MNPTLMAVRCGMERSGAAAPPEPARSRAAVHVAALSAGRRCRVAAGRGAGTQQISGRQGGAGAGPPPLRRERRGRRRSPRQLLGQPAWGVASFTACGAGRRAAPPGGAVLPPHGVPVARALLEASVAAAVRARPGREGRAGPGPPCPQAWVQRGGRGPFPAAVPDIPGAPPPSPEAAGPSAARLGGRAPAVALRPGALARWPPPREWAPSAPAVPAQVVVVPERVPGRARPSAAAAAPAGAAVGARERGPQGVPRPGPAPALPPRRERIPRPEGRPGVAALEGALRETEASGDGSP